MIRRVARVYVAANCVACGLAFERRELCWLRTSRERVCMRCVRSEPLEPTGYGPRPQRPCELCRAPALTSYCVPCRRAIRAAVRAIKPYQARWSVAS